MAKSFLYRGYAAALMAGCILSAPAAFARVDVETIIASNLTAGEEASLVELFRGSYSELAKTEVHVVTAAAPPQASAPAANVDVEEAPNSAPAAAPAPAPTTNLPAPEERVELSFVKLESRIQVRATRFNAAGKQVHSVSAMLAQMDEAPEVMARVARALYSLKSFEDTENIDNITTEESKTPRKKSAEFVGGIRTSLVAPVAPNQAIRGYGTLGFDGRIEAGDNVVRFGAGGAIPLFTDGVSGAWQVGGIYADLGYSRYLTHTPVSPYLGLGVMPRIWGSDGGAGVNVLPYLQAGVMFLRDHNVRFYMEGLAGYNVVSLGENAQGEYVRPWEFGGAIGIGF